MKLKSAAVSALIWIAAGGAALFAQFTPEEIARRPEMENFLLTAEIVNAKRAEEGVTRPYVLDLKRGDLESRAIWKNPHGWQQGFLEGWQYEIAAYRLDKLIGLDMIPPAVEREYKGKKGALILWAKNRFSLLKMTEEKVVIPPEAVDQTEKRKWLTRAWDSLIANEDRTQQNVLYTEDWRTIIIDHSRAFRSSEEFTRRLMFGANGIKSTASGAPFLFRRLPRWFVAALKELTAASVKGAVGTTLTEKEVKAILIRRDLLIKEIEWMIQDQKMSDVLYD